MTRCVGVAGVLAKKGPTSLRRINRTECEAPFDPVLDDQAWPGSFPKSTNMITFNIITDDYPYDTDWEWSSQDASGDWQLLDSSNHEGLPGAHSSLFSYTKNVTADTNYRLRLLDNYGDGVCCLSGLGWFAVTTATPSPSYPNGTVIWSARGDALRGGPGTHVKASSLDVYVWIDADGNAHVVE